MCRCGHKLLRICTTTTNLVLRPMVAKEEIQSSIKILKSELKMKDNLIKFRVSKIETLIIKKKASNCGVSVSELMRGLALDYKLSNKLTPEEIECYQLLSKYADNFRRISNLFKLGDTTGVKEEAIATSQLIRAHLLKLK
jgi:predicted DNA binding CopG/RHH family protein